MIALFLAAAILSSERVGEFFSVPKWMYNGNIRPEMTPGSDAWYVGESTSEEFVPTNVVVKFSKVIRLKGSDQPVDSSQDVTGDLLGDAVLLPNGNLDISKCVAPPAKYGTDLGRYEPRGVWQWIGEPSDWHSGNDYYIYHGYDPLTYVTNGVTIVHTNVVARATRMTPEMHASIIATLEALHERMFYSSLTNRMSESDKETLKSIDLGFIHVQTNRTVTSRRLDQYESISAISQTLRDLWLNGMAQYISGWREDYSPVGQIKGDIFWSTTSMPFTYRPCFPEFDWTDDLQRDAFSTYHLAPAFFSFANQEGEDGWRMDVFDNVDSCGVWEAMLAPFSFPTEYPAYWHLAKEDGLSDEEIEYFGGGMSKVLGSVFKKSNSSAITNETHRLVSDRLSTVNQVLGLLDRTIEFPDFKYDGITTNVTHDAFLLARAKAHVGGTFYWNGFHHTVETNGTFRISDFEVVNITNTSERSSGHHEHIIFSVEGDISWSEVAGEGRKTLGTFGMTPRELLSYLYYQHEIPTGTKGTVTFYPDIFINEWTDLISSVETSVYVNIYGPDDEFIDSFPAYIYLGDVETNGDIEIDVDVSAAISRSYKYCHTLPGDNCRIGRLNGFGKVKSEKAAIMCELSQYGQTNIALHDNVHFAKCPESEGLYDNNFYARYVSSMFDYRGREGLKTTIRNVYGILYDKVSSKLSESLNGGRIDDWSSIIPIDAQILKNYKDFDIVFIIDTERPYEEINGNEILPFFTISYEFDSYGNIIPTVATEYLCDYVEYEDTIQLDLDSEITFGSVIVSASLWGIQEKDPFEHIYTNTAEGRMNVMTEHVWDWEYLKRKDNQ